MYTLEMLKMTTASLVTSQGTHSALQRGWLYKKSARSNQTNSLHIGHTCCMIQLGSLCFIWSEHIDLNPVYPDRVAKISAKRTIYFPATHHFKYFSYSHSEYIWKLCIWEKFQYIPALETLEYAGCCRDISERSLTVIQPPFRLVPFLQSLPV